MADAERQALQRRAISLEESLKLHRDLLQKLNLAQLLGPELQQPQINFSIQNAGVGLASHSASTNPSQIDFEQHRQSLERELEQFRRLQNQKLDSLQQMQFSKDTTPPAVPHIQYPP